MPTNEIDVPDLIVRRAIHYDTTIRVAGPEPFPPGGFHDARVIVYPIRRTSAVPECWSPLENYSLLCGCLPFDCREIESAPAWAVRSTRPVVRLRTRQFSDREHDQIRDDFVWIGRLC